MAMIVQHNMQAMNANRMLGVTTGQQSKSTEKLSTGYKINRAADDAAGLTISEKMRSQVRGLNRASVNAQDGVSLIQTAEGAINEVHSILQRMNELAVQGANDTNQLIDREAVNEELNALTTEIDRIASTTQFNKQELLDGTFEDKKLQVGANTNQNIAITIQAMNATAIGLNDAVNVTLKGSKVNTYSMGGSITGTTAAAVLSIAKSKAVTAAGLTNASAYIKYNNANAQATKYSVNGTAFASGNASALDLVNSAAKSIYNGNVASVTKDITAAGITTMTSNTAGSTVAVTAPTVSNYEKAQATLSKIQLAINNVSKQRSALGALQNRLEHTISNLDNVAENTQAAESRIRDTDMASEMVEYSKNNILAQAGQSMLAQANQSTQGVLSLLQ